MKKSILMLALAGGLTGCGSMIQAVNGYGAVAIDNAKMANDTLIAGWTTAACATPISAALRNPHIIPAIKQLCFPPGDVAPSQLLDPVRRPGRE